jgi:transcription elongation factor GreA
MPETVNLAFAVSCVTLLHHTGEIRPTLARATQFIAAGCEWLNRFINVQANNGYNGIFGCPPCRQREFFFHRMPEHIKRKLEDEIRALEHELAHELPKEIKKAAALGDLSENAEYHMAKQRQELVNARLGQLKRRMSELALVNLSNIPKDRVAFGSRVKVFDSSKEAELEYKLVTSEEADVTKGFISTTSPIGKALMGKKVGDTATVVTPNGRREMEILNLTTIHEEAQ